MAGKWTQKDWTLSRAEIWQGTAGVVTRSVSCMHMTHVWDWSTGRWRAPSPGARKAEREGPPEERESGSKWTAATTGPVSR